MKFTKYLSGSTLLNNKNEKIGIVKDLVVDLKYKFPRTTFLVVHLDKMEMIGGIKLVEAAKNVKMMIPWNQVGSFKDYEEKKIKLKVSFKEVETRGLTENELLVGENILDQQIISSDGIGLRRVSDVVFIEEDGNLVLAGLSVGISGVLDQLGFEWPAKIMNQLLLFQEYKEDIIPWSYVKEYLPHKQQIKLRAKDGLDAVEKITVEKEDEEAIKLIHKRTK